MVYWSTERTLGIKVVKFGRDFVEYTINYLK